MLRAGIRTMRTGFTVQSEGEYRVLRKAMRYYRECGEKSDYGTMEKVAGKLGKSVKETIEIIQAGLRSTQFVDYYRKYSDEDSEESRDEAAYDSLSDTEYLFFRLERANATMEAFENLDDRERAVVSAHLGFCMECYSITDKGQSFINIAIDHALASPDTADKIYRRTLRKMKMVLEKQGT